MERKTQRIFIMALIGILLIGQAQADIPGADAVGETVDKIGDFLSGGERETSEEESSESYNSQTNVISPNEFPVNPEAEYEYNQDLWLTVTDDIMTRATVKLWGDTDFQSYRCYSVISDQDYSEKGVLDPKGDDIVIDITLNRLGEARVDPPAVYNEEVNTVWAKTDIANEDMLQTQCFGEGEATNLAVTDVSEQSVKNEDIDTIDDLRTRYYTPKGEYSLGFETSGRANFENKYRFDGVETRSCTMEFEDGLKADQSGKVTVENGNDYPIRVNAHWDVDRIGLGGDGAWIKPESTKELSFSTDLPIPEDKRSLAGGDQTEYSATVNPAWMGSGGGGCQVSCQVSGPKGVMGQPANNNPSTCERNNGGSSYWEKHCTEEGYNIDEEPVNARDSCISDIEEKCVEETDGGIYECEQLMTSLCGDLYGNNEVVSNEGETGLYRCGG